MALKALQEQPGVGKTKQGKEIMDEFFATTHYRPEREPERDEHGMTIVPPDPDDPDDE